MVAHRDGDHGTYLESRDLKYSSKSMDDNTALWDKTEESEPEGIESTQSSRTTDATVASISFVVSADRPTTKGKVAKLVRRSALTFSLESKGRDLPTGFDFKNGNLGFYIGFYI
ncbi:tRNA/rRNA methyltransferase [Striga asiatica]|uniref:tRNA/rRNA methyltransferase n=1 Tax=Striga asiatica TaxID=4170 RepID=A0A5A7R230_STRAF|nr:tRNA/rRNA methyltransferase [Striga asiatica]